MSAFRFEFGEVDDSNDQQQARGYGTAGEELTKVHRVQAFGLYSNPPVGSHGIGLALGGQRDLVAVLGGEHPQYRPRNVPPGQAQLYDASGNVIWAKGGDGMKIDAGGRAIEMTTSGLQMKPGPGGGPAKIQVGDLTIEVTGVLRLQGGDIRLGPAGSSFQQVQTTGGASPHVRASV